MRTLGGVAGLLGACSVGIVVATKIPEPDAEIFATLAMGMFAATFCCLLLDDLEKGGRIEVRTHWGGLGGGVGGWSATPAVAYLAATLLFVFLIAAAHIEWKGKERESGEGTNAAVAAGEPE
ncbi:MAG: hypothetical protein ACOZNI_19925 [Myxococcota bacterium]